MTNFVVLISKGPFHGVEAEWPLRFVNQALDDGHKVKVYQEPPVTAPFGRYRLVV